MANLYTLFGPSSGVVGVPSISFSVTLGTGTLSGTVIVTPEDGGNGGTFVPSSVTLSDSLRFKTFTYTPLSTGVKTIGATNDGGLTNPTAIPYTSQSPGSASSYLVTGPSSGIVNNTSSDFTVTLDGTPVGTTVVTITPSGGGLSTPIDLSFSGSTTSHTFTLAPTATGIVTLVFTNNSSLPNWPNFLYASTTLTDIDTAWLANSTNGGPSGPYYLQNSNTTYRLTTNVSTDGTAFFVLNSNITFDLNGHTVSYDNNTPPGVPNGGFETGTPGSPPPNWDVSEASGAVIKTTATSWWNLGFWGNNVLEIPNITSGTTKTIYSDLITIPSTPVGAEYCAMIMPKIQDSSYSATVTITVVDGTTRTIIPVSSGSATGQSYDPRRGTLAFCQFVPTTPGTVRLKVDITAASTTVTADLDHADLTRSRETAIVTTTSTSNLPAYLITTQVNNRGNVTNTTIKNGIVVGGTGRSYGGNIINSRVINGCNIDNVNMTSYNVSAHMIDCQWSSNITVTNCTMAGNMDVIDDRMIVYGAIRLSGTYGVMYIAGNTISGSLQDGIVVAPDPSTGPFTLVKILHNDIRIESRWTDAYAIGLGSVANIEVGWNTVIASNGRGLFIDGKIQNEDLTYMVSGPGTVHDNHFECQERPNLEYLPISLGTPALMIRNGAVHNIIFNNNDFWSYTGIDQAWSCIGIRIEATNGQVTGGDDYSNVNDNANLLFSNNHCKAIVLAPDPALTDIWASQAWAASFNNVFPGTGLTLKNNIFESNITSLALGDDYGDICQDITFNGNTIVKNTTEGTIPPPGIQRPYMQTTAGDFGCRSSNNRLIDMRYSGGATEGFTFLGASTKYLYFGWVLDLTVTHSGSAVPGANVTITDSTDVVQFTGTTDSNGQCLGIPVLTDKYATDGSSGQNTTPIHTSYNASANYITVYASTTSPAYSGTAHVNLTSSQTLTLAIS